MKTTQILTDKLIQNIKTDKPRIQITDAKTTGLKLRVSRSGHKSFALMIRNSSGKYATFTIGTYPDVSLKKAREIALQSRVDLKITGLVTPTAPSVAKQDETTLRLLLGEAQSVFAGKKKTWRPRGIRKPTAFARRAIENVFENLLDKPVEAISAKEFGYAANSYKPKRPLKGKTTANGQVSRALSYLSPVLDWAAHRGRKYGKFGAGRKTQLNVAELLRVNDPSTDDPTIKGKRDRVLTIEEIAAIYPLLRHPTPDRIRRKKVSPKNDYGPIAMRFLLLSVARREEVASAKWNDFDFINGVWTKPEVKDATGKGRSQRLPLSEAALNLLKSLPGFKLCHKDSFVFPNRDGGKLDNWNRIAAQVQKGSKTSDWTRHDLRRTGATLLEELQVPVQTVEAILDHTNRFANAGVSGSAGHYMVATRIMNVTEDPKVTALNKLSTALDHIVAKASTPASFIEDS